MTWIDRQMEGYRPSKSLASASGKKAKEPEYEQLTLPFVELIRRAATGSIVLVCTKKRNNDKNRKKFLIMLCPVFLYRAFRL